MSQNRSRFNFYRGSITVMFLTIVVLASGCRLRVSANLHEIDRGKYYRSAQLWKNELDHVIPALGIKTIINLRGSENSDFIQDEIEMAHKHGAFHFTLGMSASRLPHREDLIQLLDYFRDAPRPLLVHCKAGADRAGEAAAIYKMLYMDTPKKEALEMLTLKFLHVALTTPAKRYFIKNVWPDQIEGSEDYMRENYDPCLADYKYYNKEDYCQDGQLLPAALHPPMTAEDDT